MRQSKYAYYADFVVYPLVVAAILGANVWRPQAHALLAWLVAFLLGMAAWTLIEYGLHRFVFHRFPIIAAIHDMHHENPRAYVGTPIWVSLATFGCGFIALRFELGTEAASGVTAGLMTGYLWYVVLHDAVHRRQIDHTSPLYRAKLRHARHHHGEEGNFGVITAVWDHAFGTAVAEPPAARRSRSARA